MPTATAWAALFAAAPAPPTVDAHTFFRAWPSWSQPVALGCSDGTTYVVKAVRAVNPLSGRAMVTEQIVAKLGIAIGAPVPRVTLVDVPAALIAMEPAMAELSPGIAHGSELVENCGDRIGIAPPTTERNRRAYAALAVLYGWAQAGDHQLVSRLDAAGDLFSVDHGFFFPGAPGWDTATLQGATPVALEPQFAPYVHVADYGPVLGHLKGVSDEVIANIVAAVPVGWGFAAPERVAVAEYLSSRRATLVTILEGM